MSILNGPEVRGRAAELAAADAGSLPNGDRGARPHLAWLAERSGIPVGTIQNATRDNSPQVIALNRVVDIARVLRRDGESLRDVVVAITAGDTALPSDRDLDARMGRAS
jgi:hypothetical protein